MNRRPVLAPLVSCLFLAGCQFLAPPKVPPPPDATVAPTPSPPIAIVKPPSSPSKPSAKPAPLPPPVKAAHPSFDPAELVGLDGGGLHDLLGEPAQSRIEGAAHVLTYRSPHCSLDILLYPDIKAAAERVVSYQFDGASPDPRGCYGDLRRNP